MSRHSLAALVLFTGFGDLLGSPQSLAHGQSQGWIVETLLLEGQSKPGLGTVVKPTGGSLNATGDWAAQAILTPDGINVRRVVLKNGEVVIGEGDALAAPFGSMLHTVASSAFALGPALDDRGDVFWNGVFVPAGGLPTSCIGRNDGVLLTPFESELAPGGPVWVDFFSLDARGEGQLLIGGRISDPVVPFPYRTVLARVEVGADGQVAQSTVVAEVGVAQPVLPGPIAAFSGWNTGFSVGPDGAFAWTGEVETPSGPREAVARDGELLGLAGGPASSFGEWVSFDLGGIAIGPAGASAWRGRLIPPFGPGTPREVIFLNNFLLWLEGQTLPAQPTRLFTRPLVAPLVFTADGRVAVMVAWESSDGSTGESLFLGLERVVQVGDATAEGFAVTQLFEGYRAMDFREDGAVALVDAQVDNGRNGLLRARRAGAVQAFAGCTDPAAELRATAGAPQVGAPLALEVNAAGFPSAALFLGVGPSGLGPLTVCGPQFPGIGELLLQPDQFDLLPLGNVAPPAAFEAQVPFVGILVGQKTALQALLVGGNGQAALTNGLQVTIGG